MAKYKIYEISKDFIPHLTEVHVGVADGYHRVIFTDGIAYTDSEFVAEYFRGRGHGEIKQIPGLYWTDRRFSVVEVND